MIPTTGHAAGLTEVTRPPAQEPAGGSGGELRRLFPDPPAAPPPTWRRRMLTAAAAVAAVVAGAAVLLLRVPGVPSWDTIYAEDYNQFLLIALQHPWDLLVQYNGYEQLLPRAVAQLVTYLPVAYAAKAFACAGALTAAACAVFIFQASAGHIRSVRLRFLLAAGVILLSTAPMEIADSTVDAPWYLLLALFWAVFWRPRTRAGLAVAFGLAFVTVASTSIAVLFAPLLAIRVYSLRRVRDHAVTAGWLAGCLIQVPFVYQAIVSGNSRLTGGQNPGFARSERLGSVLFYVHDVILRSAGWRLSWWLQSHTTTDWATLIVAVALTAVLGGIFVASPGTRPFIGVALLTGLLFTAVSVFLTPWAPIPAVTFTDEVEARYTALPIFLIEAALIIGVDYALRSRHAGGGRQGTARRRALTALGPALAVTGLVVVLGVSWVADFRYTGMRSAPSAHPWPAIVATWQHDCRVSRTGYFDARTAQGSRPLRCDRLRS